MCVCVHHSIMITSRIPIVYDIYVWENTAKVVKYSVICIPHSIHPMYYKGYDICSIIQCTGVCVCMCVLVCVCVYCICDTDVFLYMHILLVPCIGSSY